jgi:hypothetical protein
VDNRVKIEIVGIQHELELGLSQRRAEKWTLVKSIAAIIFPSMLIDPRQTSFFMRLL